MRSSRAVGILAGTAAIALATLVVAAPGSAATLPEGQRITIVESIDANEPPSGQFFDVNPANAASSPVGTAPDEFILGLEVDDAGLGAAIGQLDSTSTIWTANANTGALSDPHPITMGGDVDLDSCGAIDLVNGTFIISCVEGGNAASHVGSVDPATGIFTSFLELNGQQVLEFDALATDTTTGQLWGFAEVGGVTYSYTLDLENDIVDEVSLMEYNVYAADFDRDGQLFVSADSGDFALGVADPVSGVFSFDEPFVSTATDETLELVAALTIWGAATAAPALPATGASGADLVPVGIGSALLLLAGAAFVATSRVHRRSV